MVPQKRVDSSRDLADREMVRKTNASGDTLEEADQQITLCVGSCDQSAYGRKTSYSVSKLEINTNASRIFGW